MNNDTGIYAITSPSGKQYIGSAVSIKRRWRRHLSDLARGRHHSPSLQRAWDKYGDSAFTFSVVARCPVTDLLAIEQARINALRPAYNIALVAGASGTGLRASTVTRLKMSIARKGRKHAEETKVAIGLAQKGRRRSANQIAAWIAVMKGRKCSTASSLKKSDAIRRLWLSEEYRASILPSRQGERNPNFGKRATDKNKAATVAANSRSVVCIETGVMFRSAADAARWLIQAGIEKAQASPITQLCKGRGNIAYGYRWRYADQ
jgi:group I intron endonuclease